MEEIEVTKQLPPYEELILVKLKGIKYFPGYLVRTDKQGNVFAVLLYPKFGHSYKLSTDITHWIKIP